MPPVLCLPFLLKTQVFVLRLHTLKIVQVFNMKCQIKPYSPILMKFSHSDTVGPMQFVWYPTREFCRLEFSHSSSFPRERSSHSNGSTQTFTDLTWCKSKLFCIKRDWIWCTPTLLIMPDYPPTVSLNLRKLIHSSCTQLDKAIDKPWSQSR